MAEFETYYREYPWSIYYVNFGYDLEGFEVFYEKYKEFDEFFNKKCYCYMQFREKGKFDKDKKPKEETITIDNKKSSNNCLIM
jgi:hypothetical protein